MRVAFTTLGCKANQFDTSAIEDSLRQKTTIVDYTESADIYVVNTCTVTHRADSDARKLIRKAKRQNPDAKVIVTGCYAQTQPEVVAAVEGVDLVVGNSHKDQLSELILAGGGNLPSPGIMVDKLDFKQSIPDLPPLADSAGKTRAFVKIQDGCDYSCSFCIITIARGANTSLSVDSVISQIRQLEAAGIQEVVLTGVQIGRYGRDLDPVVPLHQAVIQILEQTNMPRIRLSSIDPRELTSEMIAVAADNPRICPHFHIPIQSGDDAILMLMRRNHDRALMRDLFSELKSKIPDVMIGSDIIVGFPGEGPSEFDMTVDFVETWIDHAHVFSYSDRPGTVAESLPEKIPADVIARRSRVLRQLGEEKRAKFGLTLVGSIQPLLVENRRTEHGFLAYTPHYIPVAVDSDGVEVNQIVPCRIDDKAGILVGEPV